MFYLFYFRSFDFVVPNVINYLKRDVIRAKLDGLRHRVSQEARNLKMIVYHSWKIAKMSQLSMNESYG